MLELITFIGIFELFQGFSLYPLMGSAFCGGCLAGCCAGVVSFVDVFCVSAVVCGVDSAVDGVAASDVDGVASSVRVTKGALADGSEASPVDTVPVDALFIGVVLVPLVEDGVADATGVVLLLPDFVVVCEAGCFIVDGRTTRPDDFGVTVLVVACFFNTTVSVCPCVVYQAVANVPLL